MKLQEQKNSDFNCQVGGDAVAFLVKHENKNMFAAVKQLIGETFDPQKLFSERINARNTTPKMPFILPPRAEDNNRVFVYLIKTRGIDRAIVKQCIDDGSIYQSHEVIKNGDKQMTFNNCIFVGKDANGEALTDEDIAYIATLSEEEQSLIIRSMSGEILHDKRMSKQIVNILPKRLSLW